MPAKQTTLLEELSAAARGCLALLIGDRKAPDHFDFSQRGLFGSFIAFLVAALVGGVMPLIVLADAPIGILTRQLLLLGLLYGAQIGISALVLRQFGRLDGLVPYIVASNWASLFATLISSVFGFLSDIVDPLVIVAGIVLQINLARLIVTLSGGQTAIFLISQVVGLTIAFILVVVMFPGLVPEFTRAFADATAAAQTAP